MSDPRGRAMSEPLPEAVERVLEAARAVVRTWRKDDPQYVRSSDLMDDIDVLEVALAAFVGSEEPSGTSDRQSFSEGALRVGAPVGSSVPAGRELREIERLAATLIGRFPIACGGRHFEGRTCDYCLADDILRVVRGAIDEMQLGGQSQPWEAGTHGSVTCAVLEDDPPRSERDGSATLDTAPRAGERTNTLPPGPPPLTVDVPGGAQHAGSAGPPTARWTADAEHDALVDLLLACGLMLERRDAQGRGAARARLRESMAAAQQALGLDAPPVIVCRPAKLPEAE